MKERVKKKKGFFFFLLLLLDYLDSPPPLFFLFIPFFCFDPFYIIIIFAVHYYHPLFSLLWEKQVEVAFAHFIMARVSYSPSSFLFSFFFWGLVFFFGERAERGRRWAACQGPGLALGC